MKQIFIAALMIPLTALTAVAADEEAREYGEYLAGECTTCHSKDAKTAGDTGIPPLADISGWDRETFIEAMTAFKTKERDNAAMVSVASALDDEQLTALAIYFASMKPADDAVQAPLLEPFKWSPKLLTTIASGNAEKGKAIAEEAGCSGCHGEQGQSEDAAMPNLAGQVSAYIVKQLYDFKQGARKSEFMTDPVQTLDLAQMADLAAWYSGRPPQIASRKGAGGAAQIMAEKGDKARLLIGCDICHGSNGDGRAVEVPAIGGQKRDYLLSTMMAFRTGERNNDHYRRMEFIASTLTKQEIEQLADYYAEAPELSGPSKVSPAMSKAIAGNVSASASGKKSWKKCKSCHTVKKGGRNKSGPNLFDIVDKPAGSVAGYRYSAQLKKRAAAGLIWTPENLDKWLLNPKKFIGGRTKMSRKTKKAKIRKDVIKYLKTFR